LAELESVLAATPIEQAPYWIKKATDIIELPVASVKFQSTHLNDIPSHEIIHEPLPARPELKLLIPTTPVFEEPYGMINYVKDTALNIRDLAMLAKEVTWRFNIFW
jgi:hypothetical protein